MGFVPHISGRGVKIAHIGVADGVGYFRNAHVRGVKVTQRGENAVLVDISCECVADFLFKFAGEVRSIFAKFRSKRGER